MRYEDKGPPTSTNRLEQAATSRRAAKKYISCLLGHTVYLVAVLAVISYALLKGKWSNQLLVIMCRFFLSEKTINYKCWKTKEGGVIRQFWTVYNEILYVLYSTRRITW